jgi:NADPH:quinone reductase-like Zn-dependent oxidoreductase
MKTNIMAAQIDSKDCKPKLKNISLGNLENNQVLIRMQFAPINPSDKMFMAGEYPGGEKIPRVVGFEGSGIIEEVGANLLVPHKVGDRVAVCTTGTWANYVVACSDYVYKLPEEITFEQAATFCINPWTVELMLKLIKDTGNTAVVHTAGAGAVGQMLIRRLKKEDIKLINLVKNKELVKEIQDLNPDFVINTENKDWECELEKRVKELNCKLVFDNLAGETSSKILDLMPFGSTMFNYGALSSDDLKVSPANFIFEDKKLRGFWMELFAESLGVEGRQKMAKNVFGRLKNEYQTKVEKVFPLEDIKDALALDEKSGHHDKILLKLN